MDPEYQRLVDRLFESIEPKQSGTVLPQIRPSDNAEGFQPTSGQAEAISNFLTWLEEDSQIAVLKGYAGTGKSTCIFHAIEEAIALQLLGSWLDIWVTAPTHTAVSRIKKTTKEFASQYTTLHSALKIKPKQVRLTPSQRKVLQELTLKARAKEDLTVLEQQTLTALQELELLESKQEKQFVCSIPIEELEIGRSRLVIVDEASMLNSLLVGQIVLLTEAYPRLKILFLGDPAQLPPIGEEKSNAFQFPSLGELTEVCRSTGKILEYVSRVRTQPNFQGLHLLYDDSSDIPETVLMPYSEALDALPELIQAGESVRVLSRTNARVDEANCQIRQLLYPDNGAYRVGDILLTRGMISRKDGKHYGMGFDGTGKPLVGASTLVQIDKILHTESFNFPQVEWDEGNKTLSDRVFHRTLALVSLVGESESSSSVLLLPEPSEYLELQKTVERLLKSAQSAYSKSKKGARGKVDAHEAWAYLGIAKWTKDLEGSPISDAQFERHRKALWRRYFLLASYTDPIHFAYASTVHRAQGDEFSTVLLDMKSMKGFPGNEAETRSMLYTAASRAQSQLIFGV